MTEEITIPPSPKVIALARISALRPGQAVMVQTFRRVATANGRHVEVPDVKRPAIVLARGRIGYRLELTDTGEIAEEIWRSDIEAQLNPGELT